MRNLVRASMLAAIALSGGFTWTVGQSGLSATNRNLCELWASLPIPAYPKCEFQNFLVYVWMAVAAMSVIWIGYEVICWFRRRSARRATETPITATLETPARQTTELDWNIESHPENVNFLGLSMGSGGLQAHHFWIRGWNRTINPIDSPHAYVRAENTAAEYQGLFKSGNGKLIPGSQVATIPVGAMIDITVPFDPERKPVLLATFLTNFVPFTFFFESTTISFRQTITREQIEHKIRLFQEAWNAKLFTSPQIQVREQSAHDKLPLINEAREFVSKTLKGNRETFNFHSKLEIEPVYLKLRPFLSAEFKKNMAHNVIVVVQNSSLPGMAVLFLKELDRLESEWSQDGK